MFHDTIGDTKANEKVSHIVTELFLNISLVSVPQSCFKVLKTIRLNATHYFIQKIYSKRELERIASNHSSDIDFKDFIKLYKDYTKEPFPV